MKDLCFQFFEPMELTLGNRLESGIGFVVGMSEKGSNRVITRSEENVCFAKGHVRGRRIIPSFYSSLVLGLFWVDSSIPIWSQVLGSLFSFSFQTNYLFKKGPPTTTTTFSSSEFWSLVPPCGRPWCQLYFFPSVSSDQTDMTGHRPTQEQEFFYP